MRTEPRSSSSIRHYRNIVHRIVQHHFGNPPTRIVHKASGLTNFVFAVNHIEGQFVIRISPDAAKIDMFRKEQWATQKAREAGVPTPEVLEVGSEIVAEPYMIVRRVSGEEATHHPKRLDIVREMGRYAAMINSIPTNGFGTTFNWSANQSFNKATWKDYLHDEWQVDKNLAILLKYKMVSRNQNEHLRSVLDSVSKRRPKPTLNHGDLRLKNVIVDEDGEIAAIVDWEECLSTVAPHWELSIALHDLSIDEKHEFIEGYGLSYEQMSGMVPLVRAFNIINYAPAVQKAAEERDEKRMNSYRLRLRAYLDLYCC